MYKMTEYRLVSEVAYDLRMHALQVKEFAEIHSCSIRPRWWFSLPPGGEVYEVDWPPFREAYTSWIAEDREKRLEGIRIRREKLREDDIIIRRKEYIRWLMKQPVRKYLSYPPLTQVYDYDTVCKRIVELEKLLARLKSAHRRCRSQ